MKQIIEILDREGLLKVYTDIAEDLKDEDKLKIAKEIYNKVVKPEKIAKEHFRKNEVACLLELGKLSDQKLEEEKATALLADVRNQRELLIAFKAYQNGRVGEPNENDTHYVDSYLDWKKCD